LRLNLRKFGFKFKTKFEKNLFLILKIINRCGCPRVNRGQPQRLMGPQWLMVLTVAVGRPQRLMPRLTVAFAW
jgi:hypothetical protein